MCGIAGIVGSRQGREGMEAALRRMQSRLAHRGPDGCGIWVSSDGASGLAHTRLAIIDPGPGAAQPMADGGFHLVFNGEIYNYRELAEGAPGSGGDTKVLLHRIAQRGTGGLAALAGMYAFGLVDEARGALLLARDPLGIKPLYYADTPMGFVFASEVRAILASGLVPAKPDPQAAAGFFRSGSVPEPLTIIEGVSCLPAGHFLERAADGALRTGCIAPEPASPEGWSLAGALEESCRRHLVSDVPVGVFLSGGVDSSAIARLSTQAGQVTEAFSLIFDEQRLSEEAAVRSSASAMGLKLHVKTLRAEEARSQFEEFLNAQDQPGIDGFNTYCISGFARQQGFRVVLSGVGGDELFGGYPSFRSVPRWAAIGAALPAALRRPVGQLADEAIRDGKVRRIGTWLQEPPGFSAAYRLVRGIFSRCETRVLLSHFGMGAVAGSEADSSCDERRDPGEAVACLESSLYLRNQLLRDSDVMSMAHGLELRLPLVDSRLWSGVGRMAPSVRFAPGKQALREAVPGLKQVISAGPKRGFTLPLQDWMDGTWSGMPAVHALGRTLDVGHWSRKLAIISFAHALERMSAG